MRCDIWPPGFPSEPIAGPCNAVRSSALLRMVGLRSKPESPTRYQTAQGAALLCLTLFDDIGLRFLESPARHNGAQRVAQLHYGPLAVRSYDRTSPLHFSTRLRPAQRSGALLRTLGLQVSLESPILNSTMAGVALLLPAELCGHIGSSISQSSQPSTMECGTMQGLATLCTVIIGLQFLGEPNALLRWSKRSSAVRCFGRSTNRASPARWSTKRGLTKLCVAQLGNLAARRIERAPHDAILCAARRDCTLLCSVRIWRSNFRPARSRAWQSRTEQRVAVNFGLLRTQLSWANRESPTRYQTALCVALHSWPPRRIWESPMPEWTTGYIAERCLTSPCVDIWPSSFLEEPWAPRHEAK